MPEPVQQALKDAPAGGMAVIRRRAEKPSPPVNGWNILTGAIGSYGADYTFRASVALAGLGANRPEDAIYPLGNTDGEGNPMSGANRYTLFFPKGQTPPVDAFWSLTLYDDKGFPVENALNRQAIGDRDRLTLGQRRLADPLHPAPIAGSRQGGELAARAGRGLHAGHAVLLAWAAAFFRRVGAAAGAAGELIPAADACAEQTARALAG